LNKEEAVASAAAHLLRLLERSSITSTDPFGMSRLGRALSDLELALAGSNALKKPAYEATICEHPKCLEEGGKCEGEISCQYSDEPEGKLCCGSDPCNVGICLDDAKPEEWDAASKRTLFGMKAIAPIDFKNERHGTSLAFDDQQHFVRVILRAKNHIGEAQGIAFWLARNDVDKLIHWLEGWV
jgi:hypothetical protein